MAETAPAREAFTDPDYIAAAIDLLAVMSYGEICAFERMVEDAKLAPTLADKVQLASMAAAEFGNVDALQARIRDLGGEPYAAMEPFRAAIDSFHANTAPADWYEGLIKAYVGDGLARDFYGEIAAYLDPDTSALILQGTSAENHAEFVIDRVRAGTADDPRLGGRLALWGRRLMGEALVQAQRVAVDRDSLTTLLTGATDRPGLDLAGIGDMFARMVRRHTERMDTLGLDS